jgi:hypothetical protein
VRGEFASRSMPCVTQLRQNKAEDAFSVAQYVRIPESQHLVSLSRERGIACAVLWIICVLTAVNFDDELPVTTNKIDDVGANRLLSNEFEPSKRRSRRANHNLVSASVL